MAKVAEVTGEVTPPLKERAYNLSLAETLIAEEYLVHERLSVEIWMESDPVATTVAVCVLKKAPPLGKMVGVAALETTLNVVLDTAWWPASSGRVSTKVSIPGKA
jgi:hypothetical protein